MTKLDTPRPRFAPKPTQIQSGRHPVFCATGPAPALRSRPRVALSSGAG